MDESSKWNSTLLVSEAPIQFFSEEIDFKPENPSELTQWILATCEEEKSLLSELNYIFCSDDHLHSINVDYLQHDTYTDIITFDLSDNESIEGEIYISIDRIQENCETHGSSFQDELHRVIIHGVLHLIGYKDKTDAESRTMRAKEDYYLNLRSFL